MTARSSSAQDPSGIAAAIVLLESRTVVQLGKGLMTFGGILAPIGVGFFAFPSAGHLGDLSALTPWLVGGGVAVFLVGLALTVAGQPKPHIALNGTQAFHVETVSFGFPVEVLCMRVINESRRFTSRVATGVSATFECQGLAAKGLPSLNARWSDTVQPPNLPRGAVPELKVDLDINLGRQINIAIKEPARDDAFLFNNDSYYLPGNWRLQNPNWRLPPGNYRVVVTVSCELASEQFECNFANKGRGGTLEIESFRRL